MAKKMDEEEDGGTPSPDLLNDIQFPVRYWAYDECSDDVSASCETIDAALFEAQELVEDGREPDHIKLIVGRLVDIEFKPSVKRS